MSTALIKNGGAAFPRPMGHNGLTHAEEHCSSDEQAGMSLRDYFAAKALPSCVTAFMHTDSAWADYDDLGKSAWNIADAMLRTREVRPTPALGELLDAVKGLMGLVEIVTFRDDLPPDLAASLKDNHRYKDAAVLLARIEGGR